MDDRKSRHRAAVTRGWTRVGTAVVAASLLLPDVLQLDSWTPFAQLVAFRPVLAVAVACVGLPLVFLPRVRVSGAVLTVIAVMAGAMVLPRTLGSAPGTSGGDRTITVLAANVAVSRADRGDLRRVIRAHRPDIVVLPEATKAYRTALQESLTSSRYRGKSARAGPSPVAAMSVLVAADMGDARFEVVSTGQFPLITVSGLANGGLRVVGFHAYPPVPFETGPWVRDLAQLRRWCGQEPRPAIIAGDFNATLDHSALREPMRGCADAAAVLGEGLYGTWPADASPWLTPQIDHVLVTGGVEPRRISFVEIDGTDHRAVLARLSLP